jgi:hypothetical protein
VDICSIAGANRRVGFDKHHLVVGQQHLLVGQREGVKPGTTIAQARRHRKNTAAASLRRPRSWRNFSLA